MSKDQHSAQDFDRIFREKLSGHQAAPPADMWEKINANTASNKEQRSLLWIITNDSTIMLLILLLSFFGFAGGDNQNTNAAESAETITETSTIKSQNTETTNDRNTTEEFSEEEGALETTEETRSVTQSDESDTGNDVATQLNHTNITDKRSEPTTVSKQLNASRYSSGNAAADNDHVADAANSNESENSSDTSKKNADSSNESRNELTSAAAPDDSQQSLEPSVSDAQNSGGNNTENQTEEFRMRQIRVIPPNLSTSQNETIRTSWTPDTGLVQMRCVDYIPKHEVFAGAHVNFNLPLIFNQNTYGAFDGKELAYKPTFGIASGVRIGYTYKRQYGFQTGFIFYSRQGQDYDDKLNGHVAKRQVKLQYMQVPIILRYKFKIKKQQKFESPWVINLGTQIGILRSAQITYKGNEYPLGTIVNPEANDKDYFKPIDVSVVLGVEKEIYFTKWLMLSVGMRTSFSGDINAKDHPVMNDGKNYDKSHNFTFGFTLGLNYYLRR
ncbi:MAG: outer membrane beta-barrel protein [Flavobacteriales bacterium]|nr:outer membrane beta-barrel protein [Flavobacteriales bacterium]